MIDNDESSPSPGPVLFGLPLPDYAKNEPFQRYQSLLNNKFGMIEGCYKTIGQCVRMGYWMGLHNQSTPSDLPSGSDAWLENAERGNLWWGILIRDR